MLLSIWGKLTIRNADDDDNDDGDDNDNNNNNRMCRLINENKGTLQVNTRPKGLLCYLKYFPSPLDSIVANWPPQKYHNIP